MVGNGTSPTSATTASLSGTSQTSLNSSGSSSRLRSNLDQKKASAPPQAASSSAANETSEQCKAKMEVEEQPSAPIATINDEDFKLDGGETTKVCN